MYDLILLHYSKFWPNFQKNVYIFPNLGQNFKKWTNPYITISAKWLQRMKKYKLYQYLELLVVKLLALIWNIFLAGDFLCTKNVAA